MVKLKPILGWTRLLLAAQAAGSYHHQCSSEDTLAPFEAPGTRCLGLTVTVHYRALA
jgi:hypothetical protein